MSKFRKALGFIAYVSAGGAPLLASTGVGVAWGGVLGAVGLAAGAVLHFMDNPTNTKAAAEAGESVKGAINAVRAMKGLPPSPPRKGWSGS